MKRWFDHQGGLRAACAGGLAVLALGLCPASAMPEDKLQLQLDEQVRELTRALVVFRDEFMLTAAEGSADVHRKLWSEIRREHAEIGFRIHNESLSAEKVRDLTRRAVDLREQLQDAMVEEGVPVKRVEGDTGAPMNDNCVSATLVIPGFLDTNSNGATNDGESSCGNQATRDVWFEFTAPYSGDFLFEIYGASFSEVLSLHSECPGTIANEIVCDQYNLPQVSLSMIQGEVVLVRVAGEDEAVGPFSLGVGEGGSIEGNVGDQVTGTSVLLNIDMFLSRKGGGVVQSAITDGAGNYQFSMLAPGPYMIRTGGWVPFLNEQYDDIECSGYTCDESAATDVLVTSGSTASGIDFLLDRGGVIAGTVTSQASGLPVSAEVDIFDSTGRWKTSTHTDELGEYSTTEAMESGVYTAKAMGFGRSWNELFDELPCPTYCDETLGTPILVTENQTTHDVDFTLLESGAIAGTVVADDTSLPLQASIGIFDLVQERNILGTRASVAGDYITNRPLPPGTYSVAAGGIEGYLWEVFSGTHCWSCDFRLGTPIEVFDGIVTSNVDLRLRRSASLFGNVIDQASGSALPNITIQVFKPDGQLQSSTYTDASGNFVANERLEPGTYFARTQGYVEYFSETFEDAPCGTLDCAVTKGIPIELGLSQVKQGINFTLESKDTPCGVQANLWLTGLLFGEFKAYEEVKIEEAQLGTLSRIIAGEQVTLSNNTKVRGDLEIRIESFAGCLNAAGIRW